MAQRAVKAGAVGFPIHVPFSHLFPHFFFSFSSDSLCCLRKSKWGKLILLLGVLEEVTLPNALDDRYTQENC